MAKAKSRFVCRDCGAVYPKWQGQCHECGAWNTLEEEAAPVAAPRAGKGGGYAGVAAGQVQRLDAVELQAETLVPSGISEFDRVLGGGLVRGSVVLIGGDPGIGKSTLLLQTVHHLAQSMPCLYVSGEESPRQIGLRAERLGLARERIVLFSETQIERILATAAAEQPAVLVVDSIQTLYSEALSAAPGAVSQLRECAAQLVRFAKSSGTTVFLIGHVTKEGAIAGPRVLEHMVDTVLYFESEAGSRFRMLRAVKNRYGPTDEVGCFELTDSGIYGLADPSGLFLSRTTRGVPGTCAAVSLEGRRPLPTEIQSLVAPSSGGSPRRTTSGVDHARVAMILAVLQARIGADTSGADVYVSTVGGARTVEPAIDLAMAISIVSSLKGVPPRADLVAVGEISLTGEVRACTGTQRRLAEAARLGFSSAIVPAQGSEDLSGVDGITVFTVSDLATAIRVAFPADSQ